MPIKYASGLVNVVAASAGRLKLVELPEGVLKLAAVALVNWICHVPANVELVILATMFVGLELTRLVFQSICAIAAVVPTAPPVINRRRLLDAVLKSVKAFRAPPAMELHG